MCMCEGASSSKWPTEKTVPAPLSFPPVGVERHVPHPTPVVQSWVFSSGLPEVGGKGRAWGFSGVCVPQLLKCLQGTRPAKVGTGRRKMAPGSLPRGGPDAVSASPQAQGPLGCGRGCSRPCLPGEPGMDLMQALPCSANSATVGGRGRARCWGSWARGPPRLHYWPAA